VTDQIFLIAGLLVAGYLLLALEAFVVPGFGVPGIGGLLCLVVACGLALRSFGALGGGALVAGVIAFTSLLAYLLPKTPFGRWVVNKKTLGSAKTELEGLTVSDEGVAESDLRPAGIARFGDRRESVVTLGEYIDAGKPVRIVELEGLRVVVEESNGTTTTDASLTDR
jgi:membrane-bound serine protease (ClpP class)